MEFPVSFLLDEIKLLLKPLSSFDLLLKLLTQVAVLTHLVTAGKFKAFAKAGLVSLKLLDLLLHFLRLSIVAFGQLFHSLVELGFHLREHLVVRKIRLALAVVEILLELINGLLELGLGLFEVLFGLVALLLEEVELALPQGSVLVVVVDLVLKLDLQVVVLTADALELGSHSDLVTFTNLHKLLILLSQL